MDLHNGALFWKSIKEDIHIERGDIDDIFDVVIVGGGMSGSLAAYTLSAEGLKIAVIDKGKIGQGSTLANTGLLQFSSDIMLHELIEQIGAEKAVRFYKTCRDAIDELEKAASSLSISSDFKRRDSLYFASKEAHAEKIQKEYRTLVKYGFKTEYLSPSDILSRYSFSKPAALLTHGDAEINPYKFIRGILQDISRKGVQVFENTEMTEIEESNDFVKIHTSAGVIHSSNIIIATGYEPPFLLSGAKANLNRSYAIATEPVKDLMDWNNRELIWETARPYLYMRTTADGRIIAGGLDEEEPSTPSTDWIKNRAERLQKEIQNLFPALKVKTAYAWGAVFGESLDNLPYAGKHPSKDHIYYLLGYGGNGTIYSMLGSQIIRDLILNRKNKNTEILRLDRPVHAVSIH
ncbi:NAD(P)/FAD-dependent oxidoreductase [Peribacillus kribbensis]|uniref:NAD(P)/FAD-dependent oxidoreductase n=1 Tax=Peribacillus kribbensis TaxID=356658 RepID=UPI0003F60BD3|nr:FAD-dependent oxidoreductase [Peribacillus kribbensis]